MDVSARQLERPRWLNLRTSLGALLFGIALFSGWHVLGSAEAGHPVWAAATDLSEGTRLTRADLTIVEVDLPTEQLRRYLTGEISVEGGTVVQAVRSGELLPAAWVAADAIGSSSRFVTIPITADHAAGGALRPGDRVDVFASLSSGRPGARTTLVVAAAEVEALVHSGGFVSDDESLAGVTVEVSPQDAAKLTFAIRSADIDLVRVHGHASAVTSTSIRAADL